MRPFTEAEVAAGLDALMAGNQAISLPDYGATKPATDRKRDWLRIASENVGGPSMRQIMFVVSAITQVSPNDLKSNRRNTGIVRARHMHFWMCKKLTSYSLPQIGRYMGGKDHSTILHGIRKVVERRQDFEPELTEIERALKRLEGSP